VFLPAVSEGKEKPKQAGKTPETRKTFLEAVMTFF